MISWAFVFLFLLLVVAIIDWKFHAVPSVFLTGLLIVTLALNMGNLVFGALAGLLVLLIYEFDKGRMGIADFKVSIMIGLFLVNLQEFFIFAIVLVLFQTVYIYLVRKVMKIEGRIAYIPLLWILYFTLVIGGVVV